MLHYHGTPITPASAASLILRGRHGLVSFQHPQQMELVAEVCASFILDNGAFSAWKAGTPSVGWSEYYKWVQTWMRHPGFDVALIPDVIDGDEDSNDKLVCEWQEEFPPNIGVPVWHLHEDIDRLVDLANSWRCVALGSSGEYSQPGTTNWWVRMHKALLTISDEGQPICKLHGLRMLDPRIFTRIPLASADSTNVARNIGIDQKWAGGYQPPTKAWRGIIVAERIESQQSAARWLGEKAIDLVAQGTLF